MIPVQRPTTLDSCDTPPEFDEYASHYDAGMSHPLKRLLGSSQDQFLAVKTGWLQTDLRGLRRPRLLDYGCGDGGFLRQLAESIPGSSLSGCDVSPAMIDRARRQWPPGLSTPEFRPFQGMRAPYADGAMDAVVACMVFHHIEPQDRAATFRELLRITRPGGRVYVFEHNPANPLTRLVVRQTPIDRNAVLLTPAEALAGLKNAGAILPKLRYQLFAPPRWTFLRPLEALLGRLPVGAGYVIRVIRPEEPFRFSLSGSRLP